MFLELVKNLSFRNCLCKRYPRFILGFETSLEMDLRSVGGHNFSRKEGKFPSRMSSLKQQCTLPSRWFPRAASLRSLRAASLCLNRGTSLKRPNGSVKLQRTTHIGLRIGLSSSIEKPQNIENMCVCTHV